ncbi:MAG TPA: hypothetical protein VHO72_05530 [Bacteroidales bacterium]|nr:hypothetical protein [Bacteroidales bacterium]
MRDSEEHKEWSTGKSWLFIIALSGSLFIFMEILMMIPEVPRQWDRGTVPFTPSESVYSTSRPDEANPEKAIAPLPDIAYPQQNSSKDTSTEK